MLIPDNIDTFESAGEKLLYLKFKNDSTASSFYILHSLFTNYHLKNISGELDFLVLAPGHGIFAIEVKHGKVWRTGGKWHFENKKGEVTEKFKSPFAQVDGTMNSVRKFILKKLEKNEKEHARFSKLLFGTGIAFTGMNEFVDFGTEGHSWQVFTRSSLNIPISYFIDSLSRGWHNEYKPKYFYDVNLSRPSIEDCKQIVRLLRGDFDIDYSEINRITDNEQLIEEYTREQFSLLDFVNYNDRCLIQGSAGTGKTLMALELVRRNISAGKKVAFFCFNRKLGAKLNVSVNEIKTSDSSAVYAGTLHSFLSQGAELEIPIDEKEVNNFFTDVLPLDFLLRNDAVDESDKYDILITDEAQDLITSNYLEVFDSLLKGGISHGKWIFFGDFSNQAIYLNQPLEALDLLGSRANFTKFPPLKINCRNTKKIALQNMLVTGAEKPEFTGGAIDGEEIVNKFPAKNNRAECVEEIIEDFVRRKIPMHKISLLSPKRLESSFMEASEKLNGWMEMGLTFSTVQSFKGLENTFIILFDFDQLSTDEFQRLLYIGISRAKQKLYLVLNSDLQEDYRKLIANNISKIDSSWI